MPANMEIFVVDFFDHAKPAIDSIANELAKMVPAEPAGGCPVALPSIIEQSPLLAEMLPHAQSYQQLCNIDCVAVAALQLPEGHLAVIKTVPAERARQQASQVAAEQEAARVLPCDPRIVAVLATAADAAGNVSSAMPLAGASLADMLRHPAWRSLPFQVKLAAFRWLAACLMPVLKKLLAAPGGPRLFRDTKPENITYDPSTGLFSYIDFGLMCKESGTDYHPGLTPAYITPEIAELTNGQPLAYRDDALRQAATNSTTDVYLIARVGLDMMFGVIPELNIELYDIHSDAEELADYLLSVYFFAWSRSEVSEWLTSVGLTDVEGFFAACLCRDPCQRLTPQLALQHPFLAGMAQQVEAAVAHALPGYVRTSQAILGMLEGLRGKPEVFMKSCPCDGGQCDMPQQDSSSESGPSTPNMHNTCYSHCSSSSSSNDISDISENSSSSSDSSVHSSSSHQTPAATPKRSLLQRAAKLLKKLKPSKRKTSRETGAKAGAAGSTLAMGDDSSVAFVPGFCGLLCFTRKASNQ